MSDYPNMSYCMCQNTLLAMQQVLNAIEDQGAEKFRKDLTHEEGRAVVELYYACHAFGSIVQEEMDHV